MTRLVFYPAASSVTPQMRSVPSSTPEHVLNQAGIGNRNHTLARYAFTLVELGHSFDAIRAQVLAMNQKLDEPLDDSEIHSTILTSVNKRIAQRGTPNVNE